MNYLDVENNVIHIKEKLNPILEEIMKSNGIQVLVEEPELHFDLAQEHDSFSIGYRARQYGKTHSIERFADELNFDLLSMEERLNFNNTFEQIFRQQYLNTFIVNDMLFTEDKRHIRENQDRLDQRHLTVEEFKREIVNRDRPRNDWFRNKHEKKRFMRGL